MEGKVNQRRGRDKEKYGKKGRETLNGENEEERKITMEDRRGKGWGAGGKGEKCRGCKGEKDWKGKE